MIWNPFKSNISKPNIQYSPEMSNAISTVADLFMAGQFPFSEWEDKRIPLSDDERAFFARVCLTMQLSCFSNTIETLTNDPLMGELCMHALLKKIATDIDDDLTSNVFFRCYTTHNSIVSEIIDKKLSGELNDDGYAKEQLAIFLVANENKTKNRTFGTETAFKLSANIDCAMTKAAPIFTDMCDKISIFDTENIKPIYFREDRSIFEDIIYRKFRYPEIFELAAVVNARDLIHARHIEKNRFLVDHKSLLSIHTRASELPKEDVTTEDGYNVVRDWVFDLDDCRHRCHTIGGECDKIFIALNYLRENIFNSLAEIASTRGVLHLYEHLYGVCDRNYINLTKSKLVSAIRIVDAKDVVPFILSSSEDDIIQFINIADKDGEMARTLVDFAVGYMDKIEAQSANNAAEKLRFFGKRVDILTNVTSG
jgi:hypothetical protein